MSLEDYIYHEGCDASAVSSKPKFGFGGAAHFSKVRVMDVHRRGYELFFFFLERSDRPLYFK